MNRSLRDLRITSILLIIVLSVSTCAKQAKVNVPLDSTKAKIMWRDPGNIAARNLQHGPGGAEHAPTGKFKFLKEIMDGAQPKFDVEDEQGVRWRVKPGEEARAETSATRLLWSVGYFADEDYHLPRLRVEGMERLSRGQEYVTMQGKEGVINSVRMERHLKDRKKVGNWSWFKNPFLETKELSGLKIMMALMNNWDLKSLNNAIYESKDGEYQYAVSDVGSSFGQTGDPAIHSKGDVKDYSKSKFIRKETPEHVDFVMKTRPDFLVAIVVPVYVEQTRREKIARKIPREHAKWLGQLLAQLTEEQIRDCFRAGNFSAAEVDGFTKTVQGRIAQLNGL